MNQATSNDAIDVVSIETQERTNALLQGLKAALANVALSDAEVAIRTGLNRVTVQRAKKEGADPKLSSFVAMAGAGGMVLTMQKENVVEGWTDERKVVHRGYSYNRIHREQDASEKAFAMMWEKMNKSDQYSIPLMRSLVPNFTQDQASAVATAIQWLGSSVGFEFLRESLKASGYTISEAPSKK